MGLNGIICKQEREGSAVILHHTFSLSFENTVYQIAVSSLIFYLLSLSLFSMQQSKAVGKGSKYQTLPGKLPRALQNGEQGMHSSPDGCGTGDNDDSSIPGLSTYLGFTHRGNPDCLGCWDTGG